MRWVAALLLCLAPALGACGASPASTLPAVAGGFGTDTLVYVIDIIAAIHG